MARRPEQMGIQEYQDYTFAINDNPDRRLTDEQLLDDWRQQFPGRSAKVYAGTGDEQLQQIRGIRGHYNRRQKNEHGQRDEAGRVIGPPDRISLPYDETGEPFTYPGRWLERSLDGRSPSEAGVPASVLRPLRDSRGANTVRGTPLTPALRPSEYIAALLAMRKGETVETHHWPTTAASTMSAALDSLGLPYLPAHAADDTLPQSGEMEAYLAANPSTVAELVDEPAANVSADLSVDALAAALVPEEPPALKPPSASPRLLAPGVADWVARSVVTTQIGTDGEATVVAFERRRLTEEARPDLAAKVDWVSRSRGDGAGYDIKSFDADGTERLIEVKTTTNNSKNAPFFLTANELRCSERSPSTYWLYRLFAFPNAPRLYTLRGSLSETCHLTPTSYAAAPVGDGEERQASARRQ